MRLTALCLTLAASFATGCLDAATTESESTATSELTYSTSWYSPRLEVVARIAGQRRAADELRAVAATKPPAYATWTVIQQYRGLVQLDHDCADQLDQMADELEAELSATTDVTALASSSQLRQLELQRLMQREAELFAAVQNILKAMHETTTQVIDNLKD